MKILVIHNGYLEGGGEEEVVNSEIEMLRRFSHQVVFYQRSNREIKSFSLYHKMCFLAKEIVWSKETYKKIKEIIKKENPDIAHLHNVFLMISPSIYYALAEENIPVVQSLHNYKLYCPKGIFYNNRKVCEVCKNGNFMPSVIHKCWRNSFVLSFLLAKMLNFHFKKKTFENNIDTFIAQSEFSKSKFTELGLSEDKIFVKPNFVDLKIESNKDKGHYALFIGRLIDYKGIKTLISAHKRFPDFYLKIIGEGPLGKKLEAETQCTANIEWLGRLPNERVIEHIRRSRFVIFPSQCYENMPRVIIESFACGVPVIASRLGAAVEIIRDGQTGLHFTPGDPVDLASKIKWAWENSKKMEEIGERAKKKYEEKYTLGKNYEMLMDIYKKTIENKKLSMDNFGLEEVNCNLCGKNNSKVIFESTINPNHNSEFGYTCTAKNHGEHYRIVKCRECGLHYCSPRPKEGVLNDQYRRVEDYIYHEELKGRIKTFKPVLDKLQKYKQGGKLLDIGCSLGAFLSLVERDRWQAMGIEPSIWCVEEGKKMFNVDITQGTYRDLDNYRESFDAITMWDVIEHLDDPMGALNFCYHALKEAGVLAFSTIDIGSVYARLLGRRWPWLMQMHIYYFNKNNIKRYLEQAGFKLIELSTYKHTVSSQYLLYKFEKINRALYNIIKLYKAFFCHGKNNFITIGMHDIIQIYAEKATK